MNIVLIDIDSLRADQLGAYGQEQNISPYIDRLSEESAVFTNAYVAGSPSMPSRASMLYGRFPVHHHVETHGTMGQTINHPYSWSFERKKNWEGDLRDWWSLPETLFRQGFKTCAVSSASRYPAPWMFNFWHEYHQPEEPGDELTTFASVEAEEVADIAVDYIDREKDDFFLYAQFWDPHVPMQRSDEDVENFEDMSIPGKPSEEDIEEHQEWDTKNSAPQLNITSRDDLRELYAEYRAEINYVDQHVGRIIEKLKDEGIYEETVIILTSDHGEEFGEHGVYQEHWSTYESIQKVPLIIKDSSDSQKIDELVCNVDIAPTILEYLDIERPEKWQGRSLQKLIREEAFDWRDFLVLDHGLHTCQKAVRTKDWKMVQTLHPGDWGDKLQEMQLFNLEEDPYEQKNLALEKPKLVEKLKQKMTVWRKQHMQGSDPMNKISKRGPAGYRYLDNSFN